jgi:hypothetical protein
VLGQFLDRKKISWFGDAAAALGLGVLIGLIAKLAGAAADMRDVLAFKVCLAPSTRLQSPLHSFPMQFWLLKNQLQPMGHAVCSCSGSLHHDCMPHSCRALGSLGAAGPGMPPPS